MDNKRVLTEIYENIERVVKRDTPLGRSLHKALIEMHPVDIADFLAELNRSQAQMLFLSLPYKVRMAVFVELSDTMKIFTLSFMSDHDRVNSFQELAADELTDLFDHLSDEELKTYLNLLHKQAREKVLALLQFESESAGGIMTTDVFTLMGDYTVEKSVKLLQRLRPNRDIHQYIYVVNRDHRLEGHINLEDLVLQGPNVRIAEIMRKNELVAFAQEDRETIAKRMVHYGLMMVPVVDQDNYFLGVIPSETLVDVLVEEASEDVHKMAALGPRKYPYFETSFSRMLYERGSILAVLLIAESFSGTILNAYETTLSAFLLSFLPMLISTGGNTSSQTSAVVIQGLASGEINFSNMFKYLRREFYMALLLGALLGSISFGRVYLMGGDLVSGAGISVTIFLIVMASVVLGSAIPFVLKRFNIDPAFSAGPFLATLMDILGVLIYCTVIKFLLVG